MKTLINLAFLFFLSLSAFGETNQASFDQALDAMAKKNLITQDQLKEMKAELSKLTPEDWVKVKAVMESMGRMPAMIPTEKALEDIKIKDVTH